VTMRGRGPRSVSDGRFIATVKIANRAFSNAEERILARIIARLHFEDP
jgi:hypothetical protein